MTEPDAESLCRLIANSAAEERELWADGAGSLPDWVTTVCDLVHDLLRTAAPETIGQSRRSVDHAYFFVPLCMPIVNRSRLRLEGRVPARTYQMLSPLAHRRLRAEFVARLLEIAIPAATETLEQLRSQRADVEPHMLAREYYFPGPARRLLGLFAQYPVLARLMAEAGRDWESATAELLARLHRDRRRLRNLVGNTATAGHQSPLVSDIRPGLSDPHQGGRTVLALRFRNRRWLIYKPRSCRGEWEWRALAHTVGEVTGLRLWHPKVILGSDYGWMEYVAPTSCRKRRDAQLFYRRAGALICIARIVRAVDLHRGNLIARGAHPVFIDTETLWHLENMPAGRTHVSPLLRTGLIPVAAAAAAQRSWHALDSEPLDSASGALHRPRLGHHYVAADEFAAEIFEGFRLAAKTIGADALTRKRLRQRLRRIAQTPMRRVVRSTAEYARLRELGVTPALLGDGRRRFGTLAAACRRTAVAPELADAEARQLCRFDIPGFTDWRTASSVAPVLPSELELLRDLPALRLAFARPT